MRNYYFHRPLNPLLPLPLPPLPLPQTSGVGRTPDLCARRQGLERYVKIKMNNCLYTAQGQFQCKNKSTHSKPNTSTNIERFQDVEFIDMCQNCTYSYGKNGKRVNKMVTCECSTGGSLYKTYKLFDVDNCNKNSIRFNRYRSQLQCTRKN